MWLNFVTTGKARANIRHYLKNLQRDKAIELGRRLLDNELIKSSRSLLSKRRAANEYCSKLKTTLF